MKIGNLPQATVLNDEDMLPVVQDGKTKKVSAKKFFEKEPVVENKYNPVSENPQSGIAVAEGIAQALAEFTPPEDDEEIIIDDEMSDTSTNPVQNKVAKAYVDSKTIDPISINGAIVDNFFNQEFANKQENKTISVNGKYETYNGYCVFKVKLLSGKKYRTNVDIYSWGVFDNDDITQIAKYHSLAGQTYAIDLTTTPVGQVVTIFISCTNAVYENNKNKLAIVQGEELPTGDVPYKISFPWLNLPEIGGGDDEGGGTSSTDVTQGIIEPIYIEGAKIENFFNAKPEEIVDDYLIFPYSGNEYGLKKYDTNYKYFKVKLFSDNTYKINITSVYSIAIYDNGEIGGNVVHMQIPFTTQTFTIPPMDNKVVTAYISCTKSAYTNAGENVVIVEDEDTLNNNKQYKVSFPWLNLPEKEDETINPMFIEGAKVDNYFKPNTEIVQNRYIDVKDGKEKEGNGYVYFKVEVFSNKTYKMSLTNVYSVVVFSDGTTDGNPVVLLSPAKTQTFTIHENGSDGNPLDKIVTAYITITTSEYNNRINADGNIFIVEGQEGDNLPNKYETYRITYPWLYTPISHWNGKKYCSIGDSITFGYNPADANEGITAGGQMKYPYSRIVAENLNMNLLNVAESGANVKWALGLVSGKRKQVELALEFEPDIVTIMLGANDGSGSTTAHVPLGTINDVYDESNITFYSGLGEIVSRVQTALPNATIILLSTPKNTHTISENYQPYWSAVKDVAEKYDVLFYDLHNAGCGFNVNNPSSVTEFVLGDLHPNYKAHKVMGSRVTGFIASH